MFPEEMRRNMRRRLENSCNDAREKERFYSRCIDLQSEERRKGERKKEEHIQNKIALEQQLETVENILRLLDGSVNRAIDHAKRSVSGAGEQFGTSIHCNVGVPLIVETFQVLSVQDDARSSDAYDDSVTTRQALKARIESAKQEIQQDERYILACDLAIQKNKNAVESYRCIVQNCKRELELL